jgi:hypothetical protein
MAEITSHQSRLLTLGGGQVELQEWKVERLADFTFEWHMYIGHNYSKNGMVNHTKGAVWMLMKLADPGAVEETTTYRIGRTGLPGSGNDTAQTEWDNRATSTFYRYDQVLNTFFPQGTA